MVDYRRVPERHREAFFEYASYAFRPERGPEEWDPDTDWPALDQYNGLYEDDAATDDPPLCICGHQWHERRIRGHVHPVPGLTAVATPPGRRRRGLGRRMLEYVLDEYRERGAPFTVLWPFRTSYYRPYGWDLATELATCTCPPETLSIAPATDEGTFERVVDDGPSLARVYDAYADDYALSLVRGEEYWSDRVLSDDEYVYRWSRDGDPRGYLRFDFDGGLGERTMNVHELAYADHEAYLRLLQFCRDHDSQVETVRFEVPADDDLLALVTNPEDVEWRVETGPMIRVVSVVDALSSLSYPDVDVGVGLSVDDPLVEWNEGTFRLEVADGTGRCERTNGSPDARIDVGALGQLAVGYRSAHALARTGRIDPFSDETIEQLDELFPPTTTYARDKF